MKNKMVGLNFFSIIIVSLSLTNCNYDSDIVMNSKPAKTANDLSDSTKIDFNSFIEQVENEEIIKYESLSDFLPDSVISKISKNNILYGKFKINVTNRVVVKINSNGENSGEILLFCFSELGDFNDYMIIPRYCKSNCENIDVAKEIVNISDDFEFEIIEIEHSDSNAKPLMVDKSILKKEKWRLNKEGKFGRILD